MKNVKLASILLSYTYQTQPDEMELVLGDIDFNSFIDFIERFFYLFLRFKKAI